MGIAGKKYFNNFIFYTLFKKHFCPRCGTRVVRIKTSKVVNSKSAEAKKFNFDSGDTFLAGDIEFIWDEFQCPTCKQKFSVEEMMRIERENNTD